MCKVNFAAVVNEKTPHDRSTGESVWSTYAFYRNDGHIVSLDKPSNYAA